MIAKKLLELKKPSYRKGKQFLTPFKNKYKQIKRKKIKQSKPKCFRSNLFKALN